MAKVDSTDKIKGYISSCNKEEIILSAKFFRDYTCPSGCGGCCPKFTLDYFEGERWENFKKVYPEQVPKFEQREVDGVKIFTNFQKNNDSAKCEYLNLENGRCGIHKHNPFSCEFELNKFVQKQDKTFLINKLYGRGWNMLRVDGLRGALCEMKPFNFEKFQTDIGLLDELLSIAALFKKDMTLLEQIVKFLKTLNRPIEKNISFKKEVENPNSKQLNLFE